VILPDIARGRPRWAGQRVRRERGIRVCRSRPGGAVLDGRAPGLRFLRDL